MMSGPLVNSSSQTAVPFQFPFIVLLRHGRGAIFNLQPSSSSPPSTSILVANFITLQLQSFLPTSSIVAAKFNPRHHSNSKPRRCVISSILITVSDMATIACFYYKVNRFLIIIVSNTFDELLLHYDVCWLSFSEIITWIKKGDQHTRKAWRTKEVDWGPSPSVPNVPHQATVGNQSKVVR
jgi:hypothetical protein